MSITFYSTATGQELNIAHSNFRVLEQLLHLDSNEEDCGSIKPEVLEEKIAIAREEIARQGKEWERSFSDSAGAMGARIIVLPLREEQFLRYFNNLDAIIAEARQQNVTIMWC